MQHFDVSQLKKGDLVEAKWVYNGVGCKRQMYVQHVFVDGRVHLSRKADGRGCQVIVVNAYFTPVDPMEVLVEKMKRAS